jgi:hypothetical protein
MEGYGGLPLKRGFGRTLGGGSIGRRVFAYGSNVDKIFRPWNTLAVELWQRRGRAYAWRLGLLLWFAAKRKHEYKGGHPSAAGCQEKDEK